MKVEIPKEIIDPTIGWFQSEPIVDRSSTFIAYARKVDNLQQAQDYLNNLITDKKFQKLLIFQVGESKLKME